MKTNLCFESVTYKNFQSSGNNAVTIQLNANPTTLIYGKNGSGKSSIYEALYFCLYGKSFRKSNIPDLVNNINNKKMLVTVKFTVSGVPFEVRRGRAPTIFEIYKRGKLVDQGSKSQDYQAHLEKNILKMSRSTFMQTVILGSLHYIPYMRISKKSDRMMIVEELLDIQIFSHMHWIGRVRMNALKRDMVEMNQKRELLANSIELVDSHILEMESNTDKRRDITNDHIKKLQKRREEIVKTIDDISADRDNIDISAKKSIETDRDKWNRLETLAEKEIKDLTRDHDFFSKTDSCDRCLQDIDPEFKKKELGRINTRKGKVTKARDTKIRAGIDAALLNMQKVKRLTDQLVSLNSSIVEKNTELDSLIAQVTKLEESLKETTDKEHISVKRKELGKYKGQLTKLTTKKVKFQVEVDEYEIILKLLHDDGIKKNIIKMYIPIINKLISKYLSILGFPIKFTFDENFKENIVVKGRRNLSYSSFSAGEAMRVDLALLFAFRELPIIRSGNSCNLLIFDEVADSAMDQEGWDAFLTIIEAVSDVGNVFVISPRGDVIVEKFSKSIKMHKSGAFSEVDNTE